MESHNPAPLSLQLALKKVKQGYSLPGEFYNDAAIFQHDIDTLWARNWLFAAHECEFSQAGAYVTLQVGYYPVVIVRGHDEQIRAFHNVCRHRGSRICDQHKGQTATLTCPYHQWTYTLDGRLLSARQMPSDFDITGMGLRSVHCVTMGGYVFICLAATAPDFDAFYRDVEPYLAPHLLADCKVAFESTIIEKANWKHVWENNRECYHCASNHPELIVSYPESAAFTGVDTSMDRSGMAQHWKHCEAMELPSRFLLSPTGQYRVVRVPLLDNTRSYTLSGQAAVACGLSDWVPTEENIGALLLFHFPSTWNHVLNDHAISFRVLPISVHETAVTTKWLVHKNAQEGVDYDLENLTRVWTQTNDQDRRIVEENARGAASPVYEPGPYSKETEDGVMQFVDWYVQSLQRGVKSASGI